MKCLVVSTHLLKSRIVPLSSACLLVAAVSCSEDLPVQDPAAGNMATMNQGQTAVDGGPNGMSTGAPMKTGTAGMTKANTAGKGAANSGGSEAESDESSSDSSASGKGGSNGAANGNGTGNGNSGSGATTGGAGAASMKPTVKVVPACMGRAGEMVCDGAKMIKCGEMFDAAETQPCQNEAQCKAGLAAGKCGACDPGIVKCEDTMLLQCNMSGEMEMLDTCKSPELCDEVGAKCDPAACEMDQYKCEGGELLRCKDDLTAYESNMPCPMELCDEKGKKCNMCVPDSKKCNEAGTALTVCSADGSGMADMKCPTEKPKCVMDACVQCTSDEDCKPMSDCQTSSCMNGTCSMPQNKPLGSSCSQNGGKVCSLLGECAACNLDSDCAASERCSPVLGCIERAAITVVGPLLGTYTVQVNAGYGLKITSYSNPKPIKEVRFSGCGRSGVASENTVVCEGLSNQTRTATFTGSSANGGSPFSAFGTPCFAITSLDQTSATLQWADDTTDPDAGLTGTCGDAKVGISAISM